MFTTCPIVKTRRRCAAPARDAIRRRSSALAPTKKTNTLFKATLSTAEHSEGQ
jgi:hypothetical protein